MVQLYRVQFNRLVARRPTSLMLIVAHSRLLRLIVFEKYSTGHETSKAELLLVLLQEISAQAWR